MITIRRAIFETSKNIFLKIGIKINFTQANIYVITNTNAKKTIQKIEFFVKQMSRNIVYNESICSKIKLNFY